MSESYSWKLKGLARKVNPSIAANELKRIQSLYGVLTPEILVTHAENPECPLHPIFEWNDNVAAYNYRLQQARILLNNIQVTVISDGEPKKISVYEVVSKKEGYKSIDTFTCTDIDFIRTSTIQQLTILKDKLKLYKEFDRVVIHINEAIEVIN
jgi:hypothetical protein